MNIDQFNKIRFNENILFIYIFIFLAVLAT